MKWVNWKNNPLFVENKMSWEYIAVQNVAKSTACRKALEKAVASSIL